MKNPIDPVPVYGRTMRFGLWTLLLVLACCCLLRSHCACGGEAEVKGDIEIAGRCLNEGGRPIAGVKLAFYCFTGQGNRIISDVESDETGRFVVRAPGGTISLTRAAPAEGVHLYPSAVEGDLKLKHDAYSVTADGKRSFSCTIRFAKPASVIEGKIVDHRGQPVEGARAIIGMSTTSRERGERAALRRLAANAPAGLVAVTDATGRYRLHAPVGSYRVNRVEPRGDSLLFFPRASSGPSIQYQRLRHGAKLVLNAKLQLGGGIKVTILGPDGRPLAGAKPMLRRAANSYVGGLPAGDESGANGVSMIRGVAEGRFVVRVQPPKDSEWAPVNAGPLLRVRPGEIAEASVILRKGAVLSGRVVDDGGKPIPGLKLRSSETDKDGKYVLRGLPTGPVRLYFRWPRPPWLKFPATSENVEVVAGGAFTHQIVIERLRPAVLSGKITDSKAQPVVDAEVAFTNYMARPGDQKPGMVRTDAEGCYKITGLLPGKRQLRVVPPARAAIGEHYGHVTLESGKTTTHNVKLVAALLVKIRVVDDSGKAAKGVSLDFASSLVRKGGRSGSWSGTGTSSHEGLIPLRVYDQWKPKGDAKWRRVLTVKPKLGGLVPDPREIDLPEELGKSVECTVTVRKGATLVVTVLDPKGLPVPDADVVVMDAAEFDGWGKRLRRDHFGRGRGGLSDQKGCVRIENIPPGKYVVGTFRVSNAMEDMLDVEPVRITVTGQETIEQKWTLSQGGRITGWVISPEGKKLKAWVNAMHIENRRNVGGRGTFPNIGRKYRIGPAAAGSYRLSVHFADKEEKKRYQNHVPQVTVEVKAGETVEKDVHLLKKPRPGKPGKPDRPKKPRKPVKPPMEDDF